MLIQIATVLLTDVGLIGHELRDASERAFELQEPVRAPVLIAERIRRAGLATELPDGCEDEIASTCADYDFHLGQLVAAAANSLGGDWSDTMCWFPWEFFNDRPERLPAVGLPDLADAHLHSGAAIDLRGFCRLLISANRATPPDPPELWSYDARGSRFSLKVLAHATRHFLQHLGDEDNGHRVGRRFANVIARGDFWVLVRNAALDPSVHEDFLTDLWVNDGPGNPDVAFQRVRSAIMTASDPDAVSLVVSLTLIGHALRSKDAEGLPRFVDRFDQMGLLRDTSLSDARAEVVAEACEHIFSSQEVVAAEFRKTVAIGRRPGGAGLKIRQSLRDHVTGFVSFARASGRTPRISMPIAFARERPNGEASADELISFYRLRALWGVYAATIVFREQHPTLADLITSLDVVGNEIWTSNWPIIALYDDAETQRALHGMTRTVHAGEFFRWRMQGLRSIGELVLPNRLVERIGHALALDRSVAPSAAIGGIHYRDLVEDLCWLHAADVARPEVEAFIAKVVDATRLATYGIGVAEILNAWRSRRTLAGLRDAGLVGPDVRSEADWPLEILPASDFELSARGRRALLALVYRGSGPLNLLDLDAGSLGREYLTWSDHASDDVSALLIDVLASSGVVVESCPSSNIALSRLDTMADHPIARFRGHHLAVSINSDDPLIFGTNVVREAERVRAYFGDDVLRDVCTTSVASCCPSAPVFDTATCSRLLTAVATGLAT